MDAIGPSADQARVIERDVETAVLRLDAVTDCAVVLQGQREDDAPPAVCARCGMDENYPGITLDGAGVCSLCTLYAEHGDDVHAYFGRGVDGLEDHLRTRAAAAPDAPFDCLLLYSGGKDSTYVLYKLVAMGLRVMTFTFDNGFISRTALDNVDRITGALGIEHVTATRADQKKIFVESLTQHKSVCNGCFRSLLDLSNQLAQERGIPSIVTGLSRGQIIDERLQWFYQQGQFDPVEIERQLAVGRQVYHRNEDAAGLDAVEVVDYYRYSDVTKDEIRSFLNSGDTLWSEPRDTGFCSSNCLINDVGVYVHKIERGFHNYEAPTRWEVRLGHLARAEADAELRTPVNIPRVKSMLARIGYNDPGAREQLGKRLAVYYVPREAAANGDTARAREELRAALNSTLPDFLVPEHWIPLDRIPRSGASVERRLLPSPAAKAESRFEWRTSQEDGEAGEAADAAPLTTAQGLALNGRTAQADGGRALLLELGAGTDAVTVRKAVLRLILHHEALRLRFTQDESGAWRQEVGGLAGSVPVARLDLSGQDPAKEAAVVRRVTERLRTRLDPAAGSPVQAALLDRGDRPSGLLLVIDESAADGRSWKILLEDLATALGAGEQARLPQAPSFTEWAASASRPAAGGAPRTVPSDASRLPVGPRGGTRRVLRTGWDAPSAAPGEVASAVATAIGAWLDGAPLALDVTDHAPDAGVAVPERLVGALATPATVLLAPAGEGFEDLRAGEAAAQLAERLPWEEPQPDGADGAPPRQIRLSHFGDPAALLPAGGPFTLAPSADPAAFAVPGAGPYDLELVAYVHEGRAHLDWWCDEVLADRLSAAAVPERVAAKLARSAREAQEAAA
ncbi:MULTISPECIES: condensation domain-containing protein [unclassified Streptomyces]|uniref:condensation domain-containing protein n=1 Tax=unclassified Streptomyces TaxID=2593676 RepID=UPI00093D21AA|nr:condensation domain-containing protein [Streptomyces sp. CB02058]OKI94011.1 hypothetical protein AMK10_16750 [Streptomyces sp. CB02058]